MRTNRIYYLALVLGLACSLQGCTTMMNAKEAALNVVTLPIRMVAAAVGAAIGSAIGMGA